MLDLPRIFRFSFCMTAISLLRSFVISFPLHFQPNCPPWILFWYSVILFCFIWHLQKSENELLHVFFMALNSSRVFSFHWVKYASRICLHGIQNCSAMCNSG